MTRQQWTCYYNAHREQYGVDIARVEARRAGSTGCSDIPHRQQLTYDNFGEISKLPDEILSDIICGGAEGLI